MNTRGVIAVIPAAGQGARMGLGRPKGLVTIRGTPLVVRTVEIILSVGIKTILVPAPPDSITEFQSLLSTEFVTSFPGGATRQESVKTALDFIALKKLDCELVLIHDAARCFVTKSLIASCIEACLRDKAVTAAIPIVDTLKKSDESKVILGDINRDNVWAIQTPQVFSYSLLREAHAASASDATDDSTLVSRLHPVKLVMGDRSNIKVTTREDLELGERLVGSDERGS